MQESGYCICSQQSKTQKSLWFVQHGRGLTDTAVGDDPVRVITLLPSRNLDNAVTTVAFIFRSIFHGLERCQLEWKSLPKKLKKKNIYINSIRTLNGWRLCSEQSYLDWQPAINVFKIEGSLVFAECKSIINVKVLQFFLIAHHEYLIKRHRVMLRFNS